MTSAVARAARRPSILDFRFWIEGGRVAESGRAAAGGAGALSVYSEIWISLLQLDDSRVGDPGVDDVQDRQVFEPVQMHRPASVMGVPARLSSVRLVRVFRCARPASVMWVPFRLRTVRPVSPFIFARPASVIGV